jgi:hypothetical protein
MKNQMISFSIFNIYLIIHYKCESGMILKLIINIHTKFILYYKKWG